MLYSVIVYQPFIKETPSTDPTHVGMFSSQVVKLLLIHEHVSQIHRNRLKIGSVYNLIFYIKIKYQSFSMLF